MSAMRLLNYSEAEILSQPWMIFYILLVGEQLVALCVHCLEVNLSGRQLYEEEGNVSSSHQQDTRLWHLPQGIKGANGKKKQVSRKRKLVRK
jgi:hypothetical protein